MSKTIIVFLKYSDTEWPGRKDLLHEGDILWTGYEAIKISGDVEPVWDEVKVIKFSDENTYEESIKQLRFQENTLEDYKLLLVDHYSQKMLNTMNASFKTPSKSSIDTTPSTNLDMASKVDNPDSRERLRSRDKTQPIVVLNFFKFRDIATYPDNYRKNKISGQMAYSRYARVPQKFFPIYAMEIIVGGNFISSIVGDNDSDWDSYAFVKYPSLEVLEMMTSTKIYQEALIHREAALENPVVYISSPFKE